MKSREISVNTLSFDELVMASKHSKWCTECPNTRNSIGNEFFVKKYIEPVVRKFLQLRILAETDHLKINTRVEKKPYQKEALKKYETIS